MINIIELYDLVAIRYLNCYKAYIDLISSESEYELKYKLYHRMQIYYDILKIIFNNINE